jgi:hypothetical protein
MSTPLLDDFNGPFRMARMRLPIGRWVMGKKLARVQPPLDNRGIETDRTPLTASSTPEGGVRLYLSPALVKALGWSSDGIVYFRINNTGDGPGDVQTFVVEVR